MYGFLKLDGNVGPKSKNSHICFVLSGGVFHVLLLLRESIVDRTYVRHKKLYISLI